MLALFNIGGAELILILALLAVLIGIPLTAAAVILFVVWSRRRKQQPPPVAPPLSHD